MLYEGAQHAGRNGRDIRAGNSAILHMILRSDGRSKYVRTKIVIVKNGPDFANELNPV